MIFRSFLVIFLLSFFSINLANAVSVKEVGSVWKVISEAAEEANAVKSASKAERTVQVVNEANVVKKTGAHTPTTQVLWATGQIIRECEKSKKNADKGLCSLQKNKINTCLEARLNAGYVIEEAIKQCKVETN
jgi:hypothetical protein